LARYLQEVVRLLRYAPPSAGPWWGDHAGDPAALWQADVRGLQRLAHFLARTDGLADGLSDTEGGDSEHPLRSEGVFMRALRRWLEVLDPAQHWGGLRKVHTPEESYLWLCDGHAARYGH